jgi:hypothetical protein
VASRAARANAAQIALSQVARAFDVSQSGRPRGRLIRAEISTLWSHVMNSSISCADATTHLKIVVTALITAIVVVWIGLTARTSYNSSAARIINFGAGQASK